MKQTGAWMTIRKTIMPPMPSPTLLDETLSAVARRYRLPPLDTTLSRAREANPSTALALAIEQARESIARDDAPDATLKHRFVEALAHMIRDAMRADSGDPVFQAMVLRHQSSQVREFASLSAHTAQDRRLIRAAVASIAHPGKQERTPPGPLRDALARLYAAESSSVSALCDTVQNLLDVPEIANEASLQHALTQLRDSAALERLRRLDALEPDEQVRRYRSLWERNGPRPGSATAIAQGITSQRRGEVVEASAARALEALAQRLDHEEGETASYRVVTSMRVPASLAAGETRAKTEWDAVLLRRARTPDATSRWDVCLLVEAKASVDAAATDFARLLRGLRLLARADAHIDYAFETREGTVRLSGASLSALRTDAAALAHTVLYCCDASREPEPRLLSAAGRMQLLSAQPSLEFAGALADEQSPDVRPLESLWDELLTSPRWSAVRDQYPTLKQVRELMVHPEDLRAAIRDAADRS
jgi:hypothetical protein